MAHKARFPKVIHVTEEMDGDSRFLSVREDDIDSIDNHGTQVAVYELVSTGTVSITKTLVMKRAR